MEIIPVVTQRLQDVYGKFTFMHKNKKYIVKYYKNYDDENAIENKMLYMNEDEEITILRPILYESMPRKCILINNMLEEDIYNEISDDEPDDYLISIPDYIPKVKNIQIKNAIGKYIDIAEKNNKLYILKKAITCISKKDLEKEIFTYWKIGKHKNIAKFIGYSESHHGLIIKYYSNGNLHRYLTENFNIDINLKEKWCKQLIDCLLYLSKKGIKHNDLKTDNIVLNKYLDIKLIDFNGNNDENYNEIFALGIVIWEIFTQLDFEYKVNDMKLNFPINIKYLNILKLCKENKNIQQISKCVM